MSEQYISNPNSKLTQEEMITISGLLIKAGYEVKIREKTFELDGKAKKVKCIFYHI